MTATPDVNDPLWRPSSLRYEDIQKLSETEGARLANYWWAYFVLQGRTAPGKSVVLDVGSGSGYGSKVLSLGEGNAVTGLETDETALDMSRGSYPHINFLRINTDVDWATMAGTPEAVIAFHVWEEMEHRDLFLLDCVRIMRDDAMLLISLNKPDLTSNRFPENPRAKVEFSMRDASRMLSRYFKDVKTHKELPRQDIVNDLSMKVKFGGNLLFCQHPIR